MSETYRELINTPNPTATTYEDYVRGIEDLLSKLADAGVYKGDRGESLKAAPINLLSQPEDTPLTYESFTDEGKELLKAIFDDKDPATEFVPGGNVEMLKKLDFFKSVNTYTWWCTDGDASKKVFPSTVFVYIDPNAAVEDIRDYSCLLTPKLELDSSTEEYELHYSKSEVFPSFWYNPHVFNGKGGWCWKINDVKTDIPASAANDTGEYNGRLFLVRKFTEGTTEVFKYYTSINNVVNWYTFEELQNAEKRTPLDGDIGYYLVEVKEENRDGEVVKIKVINLAVYSAGNWLPASIDEEDVLMKFDEVFTSYVWDCLSHKEIIADDLYIGSSAEKEKNHKISTRDGNHYQLDFEFTGTPYEEDPKAGTLIVWRDEIKKEIEDLKSEFPGATSERQREILARLEVLSGKLKEIEKIFEDREEGINFTSSYKHINFGAKGSAGSATKVNIYDDTYFNREGTTTFRNNVIFDGNATSDDSGGYKKPSLTVNGYDHIDISNISPSDSQTDSISISANIGVSGQLDIRGDLKVTDICPNSVTCNGVLHGERLSVRGVAADNGSVSMSKAIISKNGRTITAVPEDISKKNITKYLENDSKKAYLSSIGRTYIGDYVSTGSKPSYSAEISGGYDNTSSSSRYRYVFGETTIPVGSTLEFTYKGYAVAASTYFYHSTDVNLSADMEYKFQIRFRNSSISSSTGWLTFYSGEQSQSQFNLPGGDNKTCKTTSKYIILPLADGDLDSDNINKYIRTFFTIEKNTSDGKIKIIPTSEAIDSGAKFDIRVIVSSINLRVFNSNTQQEDGIRGIGIGNIGITKSANASFFSDSASIGNYLDLYTTPISLTLNTTQAVLFSNALLIGSRSSYFYFKMSDNGRVYICGSNSGVDREKEKEIFNPATGELA